MIPNANFLGFTPEELRPWIILGSSILVLVLVVVILARLRRIQSRPLAACVVLSIVAHGLILFGLVLFRLLEFPESPGPASILVHFDEAAQVDWNTIDEAPSNIVASELEPEAIEPAELPPAETLLNAEKVDEAQKVEDSIAADASSVENELPPLNEPNLPEATLETELTAEVPEATLPDEDNASQDTEPSDPPKNIPQELESSEPPAPSEEADSDDDSPTEDGPWQPTTRTQHSDALPALLQAMTPQSPVMPLPAPQPSLKAFVHRSRELRTQFATQFGGNEQTEAAVRAALQWLAGHQATHGGWNASQYGAGRGGIIDGQERGVCGIRADTGVTGLALLAFLASGSTHKSGEYSREISRGINYLVHQQDSTGSLAGGADHFAAMYCHGIATLAMSEAYSMMDDEQLVVPLQRALNFTVAAQHGETGGWRYRPGDDGDTSQFGWQALALHSGKSAGFGIPPTTFTRMERFLDRVSQGHYGGLSAYRPDRQATPTMTAEALVCRLALGKIHPRGLEEGTAYLLANPPGRGPSNYYYNYYGALALHLSGVQWDSWNREMQRELLGSQVRDGEMAGSWNADAVWGNCGGRVFSTATAALCMEVYYRYLPIINRNLAKQPR